MKCRALGRFTTLDEQICKLRRALRMRGDDPRFHLSLLSAPMSIASECHMPIVGVIL